MQLWLWSCPDEREKRQLHKDDDFHSQASQPQIMFTGWPQNFVIKIFEGEQIKFKFFFFAH